MAKILEGIAGETMSEFKQKIGFTNFCPYCKELAFWLFGLCLCKCPGNRASVSEQEKNDDDVPVVD